MRVSRKVALDELKSVKRIVKEWEETLAEFDDDDDNEVGTYNIEIEMMRAELVLAAAKLEALASS